MADWSYSRRLVELENFYARAQLDPDTVSDDDFIRKITQTFWATNCACFVQQAFAIIAPGCAMRPHLVRELIAHPIEAMIAGGLDDEQEVIRQGIWCATKAEPYVEPSPDGKRWLLEQWPKLEAVAIAVFRAKIKELEPGTEGRN